MAIGIRLENLIKRFGDAVAIDGLSLDVHPGEIFSLLGPSGCGKTTTLRIIAGFERPESGSVLFDGRDVTHLPPHKRQVGMVFQNYALFPHMNVRENTAFGLKSRGMDRERIAGKVRESLALVAMQEYESRPVDELSGGQQQRVALARALAIEPRLLLLDEPLSNLDARLRIETRAQLRRLVRQTGTTAIYVTHDQDEALALSDRIGLLKEGRIQQIGAPEELYQQPANPFVAAFMGHTNILHATIVERRDEGATICLEKAPSIMLGPVAADSIEGSACLAALRPETLSLTGKNELDRTPGDADPNTLKVRVLDAEFRGSVYRCRICLGDLELEADRASDLGRLAGDEAWLTIDPSRICLLSP